MKNRCPHNTPEHPCALSIEAAVLQETVEEAEEVYQALAAENRLLYRKVKAFEYILEFYEIEIPEYLDSILSIK